mgnify:FL=1
MPYYVSLLSRFPATVSSFMEKLQVWFLFWPDGPRFLLIPVADNADRQPLRFGLVLKVFPGGQIQGFIIRKLPVEYLRPAFVVAGDNSPAYPLTRKEPDNQKTQRQKWLAVRESRPRGPKVHGKPDKHEPASFRSGASRLPFSNMYPHAPEQAVITLFATHYVYPFCCRFGCQVRCNRLPVLLFYEQTSAFPHQLMVSPRRS